MATGWILREVVPTSLTDHPENLSIYGTQDIDPKLLADIRKNGVREPLRATKDNVVLSGRRRRQHALAAKLKTVPVLVARHAISAEEQIIEIVQSNYYREKTRVQLAREFGALSEAEAALARKRMLAGRKADPKGKFPEGQQAKDKAAAAVGMSRKTAEKAAAVVKKIDEAESAGDDATAAKLRETLNKVSVSAAAREAGVSKPKSAAAVKQPTAAAAWTLTEAQLALRDRIEWFVSRWPQKSLCILAAQLRDLAGEIEEHPETLNGSR